MPSTPKTIRFTVRAAATAALTQAFANLSSGQSASFPQGAETLLSTADYAWQTIFHHDALNGLIHLLGKPANEPALWKHRYYTIATNTWTTVSLGMFNNDGHIYGNSALDTTTGDLYLTTQDTLRKWTAAAGWTTPVADLHPSLNSHKNGVAFHPNLFGTGQRGLMIQAVNIVIYYNPVTNGVTYSSVPLSTGDNAGAGIYFAAVNKTITGYQNQSRVAPGPTLVQGPSTPIWTRGYSTTQGAVFGALVQHPMNSAKMLLIERNTDVSTARRYWSSTDGDNWTLVGTHPFLTTSVFCSIVNNGIWTLSNTGTPYSFIWKPNL